LIHRKNCWFRSRFKAIRLLFYLLLIPFAKNTYLALRNNGSDHKSAMESLSPFFEKLYYDRGELAHAESTQFWYEKKMQVQRRSENTEIVLDHIAPPPNAVLFESDLQTLLMQLHNKNVLERFRCPGNGACVGLSSKAA